ncbi:hypothetical protein EOA22_22825 [Mesorhizobium sp. M7A.F.Ca.US.014.04.1.1]|nr:hypothetical protein EOC84_22270 [Mesorhizobium sp. Primo-B]RUU37097.1 hypothetical protein EOC83_20085 [Mesorhizobium sp. Primo-A]RUX13310.1 hypothetical protein EN996_20545 [Mesorhizobium sp. M7A.F.Ca.CA.002.14.1.2]RUX40852.1 hypothetical protein EN987_06005 [Mesorhizobium sp. M7A.F.Ca.CA.002.11.2.1]RUX51451.1 hypothetical protein EN994_16660 [Mesorhizobium sp. M7A.F.Ca.CA.002.09.1.1]RUX60228.1 hypothetical protein EOA22_22825 [Mesorhizobium sp. M7A.F.Ca.US.014.04.1.1]RUX61854.1 hypothet
MAGRPEGGDVPPTKPPRTRTSAARPHPLAAKAPSEARSCDKAGCYPDRQRLRAARLGDDETAAQTSNACAAPHPPAGTFSPYRDGAKEIPHPTVS